MRLLPFWRHKVKDCTDQVNTIIEEQQAARNRLRALQATLNGEESWFLNESMEGQDGDTR